MKEKDGFIEGEILKVLINLDRWKRKCKKSAEQILTQRRDLQISNSAATISAEICSFLRKFADPYNSADLRKL